MNRHRVIALALTTAAAALARTRAAEAAADCTTATARDAASALLDRYAQAINAHDTSTFPQLFTDGYIQHSGRSPNGLAAQVENFQRIFASMPDVRMRVEDRVISADKVAARTTYSATHTQPLRGVPPTGKPFSFHTFDVWRVEGGKFAEHWDISDVSDVLRALVGG